MKKEQGNNLDVAEMKMLRWMCEVTELDRIRNEIIRGTTKMGELITKVHVKMVGRHGGKRVVVMDVPGKIKKRGPKRRWTDSVKHDLTEKRRKGRPKRRWTDSVQHALTENGLSGEQAQDRAAWMRLIRNIDLS